MDLCRCRVYQNAFGVLSILFAFWTLPSTASGPDPDWWPEGKKPPLLVLTSDAERSPRALLLQAARFRTDSFSAADLEAALPAALRGAPVRSGGMLLVQFRAESSPAERIDLLTRLGAVALEPIPHNGWLVRVPADRVEALAADPRVVFIGRFHPVFKLAPWLGEPVSGAVPFTPTTGPDSWRLRIRLAPGVSSLDGGEAALAAGAKLLESWEGGMLVEAVDPSVLIRLAQREELLFIEPDFERYLANDSSRGICQGGAPGLESVHSKGVRGQSQTLAVMDSGIDTKHCCFTAAGKIIDNRAFGGGRVGAGCAEDHGTHVCGTAACSNGGDHDGLAPSAKIAFQDIGADDRMSCIIGTVRPPGVMSTAWDDARSRGARVHTNSWGGGGNNYGGGAVDIDTYMWKNQDFLVAHAAGNSGPDPGSLGEYANAKNGLTVGGVVNGTAFEEMYGHSSRGPAGDGRIAPDLTTPADGVWSALNKSTASCGWTDKTGTSMATPAASGCAILVRDFFQRGFYPSGAAVAGNGFSATAALVKAVLLVSARDMTGAGTGGSRPNFNQGFGRLTLDDALWFQGDPESQRLLILDDRKAITGLTVAGEENSFVAELKRPGPVKVMLTWTDAPGSSSASRALVNDLDLVVTTPGGTTYLGNAGFVDGWSKLSGGVPDTLNNKEAVFLESVEPGPVRITVRARELNDVTLHPQDYALVVLGPVDPICGETAPAGVGATLQVKRAGSDLSAEWAERQADHYTVYRGESPSFLTANPDPYRDGVLDRDPARPGIQWTDSGAAADGLNHFYLIYSANHCGEAGP